MNGIGVDQFTYDADKRSQWCSREPAGFCVTKQPNGCGDRPCECTTVSAPPPLPAPMSERRKPPHVTQAEMAVLSVADDCGLPADIDVSTLLEFVRRIAGNVNAPPLMWVMQGRRGTITTHYKGLADEFATRDGWTVSPVYSRVP